MLLPRPSLLLPVASLLVSTYAAETKTTTSTACTASSTSGAFYDLRPDIAIRKSDDTKHNSNGAPTLDYHSRGYDYGSNFTLNLCGTLVDPVESVIGLSREAAQNVSAYYVSKGEVYSLGSFASGDGLKTRGRKLVLQYTGGSPCGSGQQKSDKSVGQNVKGKKNTKSTYPKRAAEKRGARSDAAYKDYSDEEPAESSSTSSQSPTSTTAVAKETGEQRFKSATFSFLCNSDPTASNAAISFVSTDPDECSYFFEVRSQHACAIAEPHKPGSVGPGSVFAIIFVIAVLVYIVGGVMYQRTVAHARGWRQLPNYSLWKSIWSFASDMFIALTSSCARFLPSRRGYRYVSGSPSRAGRSSREDENRLIDNLDEEWDD